jgi:hypothetical protein
VSGALPTYCDFDFIFHDTECLLTTSTETFAAAWQSHIGATVAKGSSFALLQRLGMVGANTIPAAGMSMLAGVILAVGIEDNEAIRGALQGVGRWVDQEIGGRVTRVKPVVQDAGKSLLDWWRQILSWLLGW